MTWPSSSTTTRCGRSASSPSPVRFAYQGQIQQIQASLASRGVGCDIIPLAGALERYRLVIVPTPVILSQPGRERLQAYVAGGGHLVTNFLAGIKGSYNTAERALVPAGLTGLFGMRVAEGEPVLRDSWQQETGSSVRFTLEGGPLEGRNQHWSEILELDGAEAIARYCDGYKAGEVAATRMRHGAGTAVYLGTWMEDEAVMGGILLALARSAGVAPAPMRVPRGFEAVRRAQALTATSTWCSTAASRRASSTLGLRDAGPGQRAAAWRAPWGMPAKSHRLLRPA